MRRWIWSALWIYDTTCGRCESQDLSNAKWAWVPFGTHAHQRGVVKPGGFRSPGALANSGKLSGVCHLAHADTAEAELAEHGMGTAAAVAASVCTHRELRLLVGLVDQCLLRHGLSSP